MLSNQRGFVEPPERLLLVAILGAVTAIAVFIAKKLGYHPGIAILAVACLYGLYFTFLRIQDFLWQRRITKTKGTAGEEEKSQLP